MCVDAQKQVGGPAGPPLADYGICYPKALEGLSAEQMEKLDAEENRWFQYRRRARAHELLRQLPISWRETFCGMPMDEEDQRHIGFAVRGGRGFYRGIARCSSVNICPVCSAKIRTERGQGLRGLVDWVQSFGGCIVMMTTTISHKREEKAREVLRRLKYRPKKGEKWADVAGAWPRFSQCAWYRGKHYKLEKMKQYNCDGFIELSGLVGYVTVLEVTYGENGWHFHKHTLLICKHRWTDEELETYRKGGAKAWRDCVKAAGGNATLAHGFDLTIMESGDATTYISKVANIDYELTHQDSKKSLGPFDLLDNRTKSVMARKAELGIDEKKAGELFKAYALAIKGSHFMDWSPGLRKKLTAWLLEQQEQEKADGVEKTDEEIAQADEADINEEVAWLGLGWYKMNVGPNNPGTARKLTEKLARQDMQGLREIAPKTTQIMDVRGNDLLPSLRWLVWDSRADVDGDFIALNGFAENINSERGAENEISDNENGRRSRGT